MDRGGCQGGGPIREAWDRGGWGRAYPLAREGAGDDEGDVDGVAAHHHAVEHVEEAHRGGGGGGGVRERERWIRAIGRGMGWMGRRLTCPSA